MMITAEILKKELKSYNYQVLTDGDDSVAERALEKARNWTIAKIKQANGKYDEENEIVRLILIKRALYELYSYAENESVAHDKKEDAMELLKAYFGNAVDSSGYSISGQSSQSPLPCGAIKKNDRLFR